MDYTFAGIMTVLWFAVGFAAHYMARRGSDDSAEIHSHRDTKWGPALRFLARHEWLTVFGGPFSLVIVLALYYDEVTYP